MFLKKTLLFYVLMISFIVCSGAIAMADISRPVNKISENLGVSTSDIVLLITTGGIIVMVGIDARVGLMLAFILFAAEFILFYIATEEGYTGFDPFKAGIAMLVCIVLLALALLITYKKTSVGGVG